MHPTIPSNPAGIHPSRGLLAALTLAVLLALSACEIPDYSALSYHTVNPLDCNANASDLGKNHLVGYHTGWTADSPLVVFLPGTAGAPSGHSKFLKIAAAMGYHVIGLAYPNTYSLGSLCLDNLAAYGPAREEICTGSDTSTLVAVSPTDSVLGRLTDLLAWLMVNYPGEGWEAYLSLGEVLWSKVLVVGYSQGAGHAAWLAGQHRVRRAVMLSGVVDATTTGEVRTGASWISDLAGQPDSGSFGATPQSDCWFFVHTADGFLPGIQANLPAFGLDWSQRQDVAALNWQDSGKRLLSTSWLFLDASKPHGSCASDDTTPLELSGEPVFAPVWQTLLGNP